MQKEYYIAILGRQPELGILELESTLGPAAVTPFGAAALVDRTLEISRYGGIPKFGRLIARVPGRLELAQAVALPEVMAALGERQADVTAADGTGKFTVGLSAYGRPLGDRTVTAAGLGLKRALRAAGGSVRIVAPSAGQSALSAAQVGYNGLHRRGAEVCVVWSRGETAVAITTALQDIDAYAARDHGRPARSARVGMLPPKLAQVMVNTTAAGAAVYDPFCGTGVVLQEAALLGRPVAGSDLSPEMVTATTTNLAWLSNREWYRGAPVTADLVPLAAVDARTAQVTGWADGRPVAVVTEGYLGPNLTRAPAPLERERLAADLLPLYAETLTNVAGQLPAGSEVTLTVPAWRDGQGFVPLPLVDELPRLGYNIKVLEHVPRPVIYGRSDQIVGRQILALRKR